MTSQSPSSVPRVRARVKSWIARAALWSLYAALFGVSMGAGLLSAAMEELPKLERSQQLRQNTGAIFARDGRTVLRRLRQPTSRRYARAEDLPPNLVSAVTAAEDRRFFSHHGIDLRGVVRAAAVDLRTGSVQQGGSTITQQLVKNAYVGSERSVARKSREALLAVALEARWDKRRILTAYLNTAYFGAGAYGVRDASSRFFAKRVDQLEPHESALLAGVLTAPALDNPAVSAQRAARQRTRVLEAMVETGALTTADSSVLARRPLPDGRRLRRAGSGPELAPHFVDTVAGELIERFGVARTLGGGLRVRTTLDVDLQQKAVRAAQRIDGTGLSSAVVVLDVRSGEVRAMALGGPAAQNAFNVATDGARQPGSAFKPFVLAAAYQQGLTPKTVLVSAPYSVVPAGQTAPYKVTNYSGTYAGSLSIERATWDSDNTVFARLGERIGPSSIATLAADTGIVAELDPVPSIALGGLRRGTTPLELAAAYGTFARHGQTVQRTADGLPPMLFGGRDKTGRRFSADERETTEAMPPAIADLVTATLQGVITQGTGTRAAIDRPAAGKTGTSENNVDAWFVGYTPQLVTSVWVGRPEGSIPMRDEYHGSPVAGGTYPAEIWAAFMRDAHRGRPERKFELESVRYTTRKIDPASGLLAGPWCAEAVSRQFLEGYEPTREAAECTERARRPTPTLAGLTQEAAVALLEKEQFRFELQQIPGSRDQLGTVVEQIPSGGEPIARTDPIRLFIVDRVVG